MTTFRDLLARTKTEITEIEPAEAAALRDQGVRARKQRNRIDATAAAVKQ